MTAVRATFSKAPSLLSVRSHRRATRGLSMIEVLVAMVISLIFVGSISSVFVSTLRATEDAQAQVRAHNRARAAVDAISRDLKSLQVDPVFGVTASTLVLTNQPLAYGDFVDNDGDGLIDEEAVDGRDNDGDFVDQHTVVGLAVERRYYQFTDDYGDRGVDEDFTFSNDEITFLFTPPSLTPGPPPLFRQRTTYRIDTFDGVDNVLVRERTDINLGTGVETTKIDPVVFDVVSLDILGYNVNTYGAVAETPDYFTTWNAFLLPLGSRPYLAPLGVPPFAYPASFLVRVTVNAERQPLDVISDWPLGGRQLKTVTLETVVAVESVLSNANYDGFVRDP